MPDFNEILRIAQVAKEQQEQKFEKRDTERRKECFEVMRNAMRMTDGRVLRHSEDKLDKEIERRWREAQKRRGVRSGRKRLHERF